MYQRKGTGKLMSTALISSNVYIIKATQQNFFFISSPQNPDALRECMCMYRDIYIYNSHQSVGVLQPHKRGTDL